MPIPLDRRVLVPGGGPDADAAARIAAAGGATVLRGEAAVTPRGGDLVVVDEWTAESSAIVGAARAGRATVTVLAELLLTRSTLPVLAITGTAGKTAAARLLASALRKSGTMVTITPDGRMGNAWPNHELAESTGATAGWFVAELTSTHLCHMDSWAGPDVAVVTNIWPDHIELHGSLARYLAAKRRILRRTDGRVVLNADDRHGRSLLGPPATADVWEFSTERPVAAGAWDADGVLVARIDGITHELGPISGLPTWPHSSAILAAVTGALACGVSPETVAAGVAATPAPPHRFTDLGVRDGVRLIDDAMAATPRKALAGIARCATGDLVVIAGGLAEVDGRAVHAAIEEHDALVAACAAISARARAVVLFGPAGDVIRERISGPVVQQKADVASAIDAAHALVRPGDTLILAPMFPMAPEDRVGALGRLRTGP